MALTRVTRERDEARAEAEQLRHELADWMRATARARAELKDVLHDLQIAVGTGYTTAPSAAVEACRQIAEARARADRLAETLREALAVWIPPVTPAEGVHARTAAWPSAADVARWRQVLDDQPTPTADPIAALDAEATARREIAAELDRVAADPDLIAGWLERHDLIRTMATPQAILRAVAADIPRGEVHGRRERWDASVPPGGYVCAEPDPDRPDGICGMPVEDAPCGIHHPPTTPGGER